MSIIYHENKPPTYVCQDCGLNYTHFDDHMIILKDNVWLSISEEKDVLCDHCIEKRLGRKIEFQDLWIDTRGNITCINDWYVLKLKNSNI